MIILGIESTAHTFGVGVVSDKPPYIMSDARKHYIPEKGGIHPREAAIFFTSNAHNVVNEALESANVRMREVDAVSVAVGPGLGPCLRVGITLARFLSIHYGKPLVPVNHAVAHIEIGRLINKTKDPLVVYLSGGNTIIAAYSGGRYRIFGETLDIALGNFIDTFVREIGIAPPYIVNGIHKIDLCAEKGVKFIPLPYVVKGQDVSFSGLLTAAIRLYKNGKVSLEDLCYSVRETAFSAIIEVAERGLTQTGKKEILLVGGVAASKYLREKFEVMARQRGVKVEVVPPKYAVDNGVMIAWTGLLAYKHGITAPPDKVRARQRWRLDQVEVPWF